MIIITKFDELNLLITSGKRLNYFEVIHSHNFSECNQWRATVTVTKLTAHQSGNSKKSLLQRQYKTLKSGTEDKFEVWIQTVDERWTEEIAACLEGKFPDWRE